MSDWVYTEDLAEIMRQHKPADLGWYEWLDTFPGERRNLMRIIEGDTQHTNYYKADAILCHIGVPWLLRTLRTSEHIHIRKGPDEILHGTYSGYSKHKCRCGECKGFWNAKKREREAKAKEERRVRYERARMAA